MQPDNQHSFHQYLIDRIEILERSYNTYCKLKDAALTEQQKEMYSVMATHTFDLVADNKRILSDFDIYCQPSPPLYQMATCHIYELSDNTMKVKLPDGSYVEITVPYTKGLSGNAIFEKLCDRATFIASAIRERGAKEEAPIIEVLREPSPDTNISPEDIYMMPPLSTLSNANMWYDPADPLVPGFTGMLSNSPTPTEEI
jgi:hypothetical protein